MVGGAVAGVAVVVVAATVDVVAAEPAVVTLVVTLEAPTFFDFGPPAIPPIITSANNTKIALTILCLRNQPATHSFISYATI